MFVYSLLFHTLGCVCCVLCVLKEMWNTLGRRPLDDLIWSYGNEWFRKLRLWGSAGGVLSEFPTEHSVFGYSFGDYILHYRKEVLWTKQLVKSYIFYGLTPFLVLWDLRCFVVTFKYRNIVTYPSPKIRPRYSQE